MTTNVPVDNGDHPIVSISVVYRCQGTTACQNVVDCFHVYTAQAASGTDISMQNVALIIPSPKSLVLSSNNHAAPQLQQEDSMTSGICRSLSCLRVVSQ